MITLDTLRAAALSNQPWAELDKLVRTELAAGRLTRAIYDEIMSLQEAVSDTPGYTEDSDDAIGDTLDALIGFCRAECAYKNPPILPSEEEIAKLPRWARVAFAARCARRVLPIYFAFRDQDMRGIEKLDLQWVLDETEESAATAHPHQGVKEGYEETAAGSYAADDKQDEAAYSAANAVAYAAAEAADDLRPATRTFVAMNHAKLAAEHLRDVSSFIRRDFDHLARLAEWQHWTDDTPVPTEVFGPLWPEGPPKGWPPITDVPARADLRIELFARERATDQMIEDDVVNLFNALNRYHIARSGVRLTLEQFRSLISALVPAEA